MRYTKLEINRAEQSDGTKYVVSAFNSRLPDEQTPCVWTREFDSVTVDGIDISPKEGVVLEASHRFTAHVEHSPRVDDSQLILRVERDTGPDHPVIGIEQI